MISAIIVNYYSVDHITRLLQALSQESLVQQIVIVDNSSDFVLKREDSKVLVLRPGKNLGFGRAVNFAMNVVRHKYVLLINPDINLTSGSIDLLFETMLRHEAKICGPRFFWDDDRMFRLPPATGASFISEFINVAATRHGLDFLVASDLWLARFYRFWNKSSPFVEPFLSGACLLVNVEKSKKIFDERFFMYFEDTDLSYEMLKAGKRVLCVPGAEMIHYWNQCPCPPEQKIRYMHNAKRAFFSKHYKSYDALLSCLNNLEPMEQIFYKFVDLGNVVEAPCFEFSSKFECVEAFFEVGVNLLFMPMAQCSLRREQKSFHFPKKVWDQLANGEYFCRIRTDCGGILKVWRFFKVEKNRFS